MWHLGDPHSQTAGWLAHTLHSPGTLRMHRIANKVLWLLWSGQAVVRGHFCCDRCLGWNDEGTGIMSGSSFACAGGQFFLNMDCSFRWVPKRPARSDPDPTTHTAKTASQKFVSQICVKRTPLKPPVNNNDVERRQTLYRLASRLIPPPVLAEYKLQDFLMECECTSLSNQICTLFSHWEKSIWVIFR